MDEKELLDEIKDEFEYLKSVREPYESHWKDTANYVCESLYNWDSTDDKRPIRPDRFTSAPAQNLGTLVAGLLGYTISPNITWLKISLDNVKWLEYKGVKDWLEQVEKIMYSAFAQSNLYSEAPIAIRDAATVGHTTILVDEDVANKRLRFSAQQTPEIYLDVNEFGDVDTVYRAYTMTIRQAASFFGIEKLDEQVQIDFKESSKRNNKLHLLHAVYPRQGRDSEKRDMKQAPFASVYVDLDHDKIIDESGYYENPYSSFAWSRIPGTGYGDSPAQQAMPDIVVLNLAEEARIKLGQLSVDPPMNVPEDMRGVESVIPGGSNYFKKSDMLMQPISIGMNFPIVLEVIAQIEKRVRDWFHVDFFLMLQQMQKQATATEVVELQGEKAAVLSTLIINLNSFLNSVTKRTFNILFRQGRIPDPPRILAQSGAQLKIEFVGPLAQAQKRYHQSGGIATSLQMLSPVLQMSPSFLDYIDTDVLGVNILDNNGFPQNALREKDEVTGIRQERIRQQQEQQKQAIDLQKQQMVMQNANKLSVPIQKGSVLSELDEQRTGGMTR